MLTARKQRLPPGFLTIAFMIAVLIIALMFNLIISNELKKANKEAIYSGSLLKNGKELDALVEAVKAGKILQKRSRSDDEVMSALESSINQVNEINSLEKHTDSVFVTSFNPIYKQFLATGGLDHNILIWNSDTGEVVKNKELTDKEKMHSDAINSISFSADGQKLATRSNDGQIKIWSFSEEGKVKFVQNLDSPGMRLQDNNKNILLKLKFHPTNNNLLISLNANETIDFWDKGRDGKFKRMHTLKSSSEKEKSNNSSKKAEDKSYDHALYSIAFTLDKDKHKDIFAIGKRDGSIKLWIEKNSNQRDYEELPCILKAREAQDDKGINTISFSKDGEFLVSGGDDQNILIWEVKQSLEKCVGTKESIEPIQTIQGHINSIDEIDFSPNGKTLVSGSHDRTIKVWDYNPNNYNTKKDNTKDPAKSLHILQEIRTLKAHDGQVITVSFNSDGKIMASGSVDNKVKLWDINKLREHTLVGHQHYIYNVKFSPDNKTLLASGSQDKTIKVWDLKKNQAITDFDCGSPVLSLDFGSQENKNIIVGGTEDGSVVYISEKDQDSRGKDPDPDPCSCEKCSYLYACKKLSDLNNGSNSIYSIRIQPAEKNKQPAEKNKMIATGGQSQYIRLRNLNPVKLTNLVKFDESIKALSFSTDGKILAVAGGETASIANDQHKIEIWKVENLKSSPQDGFSFKAHKSVIRSLSFNSDGILASGSLDKTIRLWDSKNCNSKTKTCAEIQTNFMHDQWVTSVSFNPDNGKILASSSGDSTIKLWDIKDKKIIVTLSGHADSVTSVSWSQDGKTLASGSNDKTIKLWDIDLELDSLIEKGCDWIRNYLINTRKQDQHLCDGVRKINSGH